LASACTLLTWANLGLAPHDENQEGEAGELGCALGSRGVFLAGLHSPLLWCKRKGCTIASSPPLTLWPKCSHPPSVVPPPPLARSLAHALSQHHRRSHHPFNARDAHEKARACVFNCLLWLVCWASVVAATTSLPRTPSQSCLFKPFLKKTNTKKHLARKHSTRSSVWSMSLHHAHSHI
jgi:hypothetical protein